MHAVWNKNLEYDNSSVCMCSHTIAQEASLPYLQYTPIQFDLCSVCVCMSTMGYFFVSLCVCVRALIRRQFTTNLLFGCAESHLLGFGGMRPSLTLKCQCTLSTLEFGGIISVLQWFF